VAFSLAPRPGFNWLQVSWGGPDELVATDCSYCDAPIPENEAPLRLMRADDWAAVFCRACQEKWWGIKSFDPPDDEEDDPCAG